MLIYNLKIPFSNIVCHVKIHQCTQILAHYHELCHGYGRGIGHLVWNIMILYTWYHFLWRLFSISVHIKSLAFSLATNTHKRTSWESTAFFDNFFILFDFFQKMVKMASMIIHRNGSNLWELLVILWYNHYLCILKLFLKENSEQTITHL